MGPLPFTIEGWLDQSSAHLIQPITDAWVQGSTGHDIWSRFVREHFYAVGREIQYKERGYLALLLDLCNEVLPANCQQPHFKVSLWAAVAGLWDCAWACLAVAGRWDCKYMHIQLLQGYEIANTCMSSCCKAMSVCMCMSSCCRAMSACMCMSSICRAMRLHACACLPLEFASSPRDLGDF